MDNVSLQQVLEKILPEKGYAWKIKSDKLFIFKGSKPVKAEKKDAKEPVYSVRGIISMSDGTPLEGASISVAATGAAITRTNEKGLFFFDTNSDDTLIRVSYTGFKSQEISMKSGVSTNVVLQPMVTDLAAVAVRSNGYQKIPQERATGSFVQINNQLFNRRVGPTVLERLEGIASGVLFPNKNIPPSSNEAYISVRGRSTILANAEPLVVVDNFPYTGDINLLNPNDVENITVLKDAAAASIWGAFSGNGVIVITTKRGKLHQPFKVEANMNITVGAKPDLYYNRAFLPANEFIDVEKFLFDQGFYDDDLSNTFTYPVISPVVELLDKKRNGLISAAEADATIDKYRHLDIRKDYEKYMYRNSVNQQYAVNVSSGGDRSAYMLSVGYDRNVGNKVGAASDRFTLNNYSTFNFWNRAELSTGLSFVMNKSNYGISSQIFPGGGKSVYYPYAQLADKDGNALALPKDFRYSFISNLQDEGLLDWTYRPLDELKFADNTNRQYHIRLNPGLKVNIFKGLDAEIRYQFEKQISKARDYQNVNTYMTRYMINIFTQVENGVVTHPFPVGDVISLMNSEITTNNYRAQLNFNKRFGNRHVVAAIAGLEQRESITEIDNLNYIGYNKQANAYNSALDYSRYYDGYMYLGEAGYLPRIGSMSRFNNEFISYYADASYELDDKYTISGSGRLDQSNIWGIVTNQKGVPLWSAGLGWNISREAFYKWDVFPLIKLRATYGNNGNLDPALSGKLVVSYQLSPNVAGLPYASINQQPNPYLRWEKSSMFNLGTDFETKNGILHGSVEVYRKWGSELIGDQLVASQAGSTMIRNNSANMEGGGMDLVLSSVNINRRVSWTTDFLFSYNWDKITAFKYLQIYRGAITGGDGTTAKVFPVLGKPVYGIYTYRWAGLDPENGDPLGYQDGKVSKDYNNIISSNQETDIQYHGPARPTFFGALRNTLAYKGLTLSVNLTFKMGYYFRRSSIAYSSLFGYWSGHEDFIDRWKQPGDEAHTNVPSMTYPIDPNRDLFYQYSSALVEKGDHIRLQDVRLGYTTSGAFLKRIGATDAQVYLYADNLGIVWKANKSGIDPDYLIGIPMPRTLSLGCKVSF
nr:SusC/RagA family TonB-linked outer membrane protein [Chitinophaga pinensis]